MSSRSFLRTITNPRWLREQGMLDNTTIFFFFLAIAAGAGVFVLRGEAVFREALTQALGLMMLVAPVVAGAMLIGAYVKRLVPQHVIQHWLGRESGMRGLLVATCAGAITPGGPFAAFPLVVALYRSGAAFETGIAYLTAWSVLGVNRVLIWEIPFLGVEFTALRYLVSLPLPILAGLLARALTRRVSSWP